MRTLALAALITLTLQAAAFADQVAVTDQMANPRAVASGKILGAQNYAVDTYGINLALADGVKPRDIYAIRRGNKTVGEAMVVFVGNDYSLLTMKSGSRARRGDEVVYVRHAEMPKEPVKLVHHEPVIVMERNFLSSREIPQGNFGSSVSFSPNFGFSSTVSYSSTTSYAPNVGNNTFNGPGFGFGMPSFGGTPSFAPTQSYTPTTSFNSPGFGTTMAIPGLPGFSR